MSDQDSRKYSPSHSSRGSYAGIPYYISPGARNQQVISTTSENAKSQTEVLPTTSGSTTSQTSGELELVMQDSIRTVEESADLEKAIQASIQSADEIELELAMRASISNSSSGAFYTIPARDNKMAIPSIYCAVCGQGGYDCRCWNPDSSIW